MKVYLELLKKVLSQGEPKFDRTGTGTRSLFGYQMRINLSSGFPLITTKKLHIRSIVHELLWFLRGETSTKPLALEGVRIWDAWANKDGELGPIYGAQWRSWPTSDGSKIDQLEKVINEIRLRPFSRRLLVSAWNPEFLPDETKSPSENVANAVESNLYKSLSKVNDLENGDARGAFKNVSMDMRNYQKIKMEKRFRK